MSQLNIDYENLHRFADRQGINRNKLLTVVKMCVSVDGASLQAAPAQPDLMIDMTPPATSRDRWMYEQGRLAERDPRTNSAAQPVNQGLHDVPLPLLERLSKTLTNLGYATPEGGMEAFGARLEDQLYSLCPFRIQTPVLEV